MDGFRRPGARSRWLTTVVLSCSLLALLPTARANTPGVSAVPPQSPADCDYVLVHANEWLSGDGVDVMSNGPERGTGNSCTGKDTDPLVMPDPSGGGHKPDLWHGYRWQCIELAARLYAYKGWGTIYAQAKGPNSHFANGAQFIPDTIPPATIPPDTTRPLVFHPDGSGYVPVAGDLIIEKNSTYGHVAIVDSIDLPVPGNTKRTVHAVEQNTKRVDQLGRPGRWDYTLDGTTLTGVFAGNTFGGFVHSLNNTGVKPAGAPISSALMIDSSGSMSTSDPGRVRVEAARAYLVASSLQDTVGIVDFDDQAKVLSEARNPVSDHDALVAALNQIDALGGTDLGVALTAGCGVLERSNPQAIKVGVFFTDGIGAYNGEDQCFVDRGWPVYVFGLGSAVNDTVLQGIATRTGGRYEHLDAVVGRGLQCQFQQILNQLRGQTPQSCAPTGSILPAQTVGQTVLVSAGLEQFTFTLTWPGSDIDLAVVSPSGRRIQSSTPSTTSAPDVRIDAGSTFRSITLAAPEPGTWSVELYGRTVPQAGEPYTLSTVERTRPEPPLLPFPVRITARHSGMVLDVKGQSTDQATPVQQWPQNGQLNQEWWIQPLGDGYVRLIAVHSGLVLDVKGQSKDRGAIVYQWPQNGQLNQEWLLDPVGGGYLRIVARHSGMVLDVTGQSKLRGATIQQWPWVGQTNQQWLIEQVTPAPAP